MFRVRTIRIGKNNVTASSCVFLFNKARNMDNSYALIIFFTEKALSPLPELSDFNQMFVVVGKRMKFYGAHCTWILDYRSKNYKKTCQNYYENRSYANSYYTFLVVIRFQESESNALCKMFRFFRKKKISKSDHFTGRESFSS